MTKKKDSAEKAIRDIRRATRRQYSAEEKIRIVLEGLRGESSIAELCRKEGINQNLYYRWSKEFLEAGKKRLAGDTAREANRTRSRSCAARPHSSKKHWPRPCLRIACSKKAATGLGATIHEVLGLGETRDHRSC
jgi:transposase